MRKIGYSESPRRSNQSKSNSFKDEPQNTTENVSDPIQSELESLLASRIDEDYIISVTGVKDVSRIEYISLQIDTSIQSLLDLPDLLPSIKHLVLDNSTISSIRDLGVGLRNLSSLSLSGCGLHDLDGIGVLTGLQELNLSDNYIADITPLTMHEHIQNLNLGGNKILDMSFGSVLQSCHNLKALFMTRNPFERVSHYRMVVAYLIPTLEMLDGSPVDHNLAKKVSNGLLEEISSQLKIIQEEIDEESRLENDIYFNNSTSFERNIFTSSNNSQMNNNHNKSSSQVNVSTNSELIPDTGSELTHGSAIVLAGNVAAAMRKRRNNNEKPVEGTQSKEFESALDVLDSALSVSNSTKSEFPQTGSGSIKETIAVPSLLLKEGDITDAVLGVNSPTKKYQPKSNQNDLKLDLETEYLMSPSVKTTGRPPLSSAKPGTNGNTVVMFGDPETTLLSATRRPQSAFSGTTIRYFERPSTSSSNPNNHSTTATTDRATENGNFSPRANGNNSSSNLIQPSPRQRNSSRPQSAVSNPANNDLFNNLKFTFNNTKEGNNPSQKNSRSNSRDHHRSTIDQDDDSEEEEETIMRSTKNIIPVSNKYNSIPPKSKSGSIVHLDIVKRNKNEKLIFPLPNDHDHQVNSTNNNNHNHRPSSSQKSLSFADSTMDTSNRSTNTFNSDNDDSENEEDIAITHSERLRLMSSAATNTASSLFKSRQSVLLKLQAKPSAKYEEEKEKSSLIAQTSSNKMSSKDVEQNREEDEEDKSLFKKTSMADLHQLSSFNGNNEKTSNSSASKAGMSLGFNLAGSLAAIDQWVHDMSSGDDDEDQQQDDDDDEDDSESENEGYSSRKSSQKNNYSSSNVKKSSLLTITANTFSSTNIHGNNSSNSHAQDNSLTTPRVLSREAIFSMCTNSTGQTPRDEQQHQQSGRRDSRNSITSENTNEGDVSFDLPPQHPPARIAAKEKSRPLPTSSSVTVSTSLSTSAAAVKQSKLLAQAKKAPLQQAQETLIVTADFEERPVTNPPPVTNKKTLLSASQPNPLTSSHLMTTGSSSSLGKGTQLTNDEIIDLLRKPPKSVPMLRTKSSFQEYFKGIDLQRFRHLLMEAFNDISDMTERESKVNRRMELLESN